MTLQEGAPDILPKGEFARLINVSPGRVSQYIAEGKLHGPALQGEGRAARIVVDVACRQLRRSLDVGQMIGNGLETRLSAAPARSSAPPADEDDLGLDDRGGDLLSEQIKLEKLRKARADNRRGDEEDLVRRGTLLPKQAAEQGYAELARRLIGIVDGGLNDMATEVAAKCQVPQRDVLHVLKQTWLKIRAKAETAAAREAALAPETVEIDPPESQEPA